MMILLGLLGCGSSAPSKATEPDVQASNAVADALCKVFQTAKRVCHRDEAGLTVDGTHTIDVAVYLDTIEERFGISTLEGRAVVQTKGREAVTTHFRHFGMSRDEALSKGTHMWGVVDGAAIVDWVLDDAGRPALVGMYKEEPVPAPTVQQGAVTVLPGWTYREGVQKHPDHAALVTAMAPYVKADGVHMVDLRIQPVGGKQERSCHVDGEPAPELCAAMPASAFPAGIGWGLKQAWLWSPGAS
ncbi:MAG: hypothetical protein AAF602_24615 [Myxococcota bacterium]